MFILFKVCLYYLELVGKLVNILIFVIVEDIRYNLVIIWFRVILWVLNLVLVGIKWNFNMNKYDKLN